ncbi:MAG TPA: hypothetical protein VGL46_11970 [Pseudonocardiaceae bacterium]
MSAAVWRRGFRTAAGTAIYLSALPTQLTVVMGLRDGYNSRNRVRTVGDVLRRPRHHGTVRTVMAPVKPKSARHIPDDEPQTP